MTPCARHEAELYFYRLLVLCAACVLALASCRGGQAMGATGKQDLQVHSMRWNLAMVADDGTPIPPTPTAVPTPTIPAIVYAQGEDDASTTSVSGSGPRVYPSETSTVAPVLVVRPGQEGSNSSSAVGQLTRAQIDAVLAQAGWPQSLWAWAEQTTWRESRWMPGVSSGEAYGLFELIPGHFARCGYDFAGWADPLTNAAVAWCVYQRDGAAPWGE